MFVCYSHGDSDAVDKFVEHLQPLVEREPLDLFFDKGHDWACRRSAARGC